MRGTSISVVEYNAQAYFAYSSTPFSHRQILTPQQIATSAALLLDLQPPVIR